MKKSEMIQQVAVKLTGIANTTRQAKTALEEIISIFQTGLRKEGRVSIAGIGTFTVTNRAARTGRNPSTGEKIKIKASKGVRFKPAPDAKDSAGKNKGQKDAGSSVKAAKPAPAKTTKAAPVAKPVVKPVVKPVKAAKPAPAAKTAKTAPVAKKAAKKTAAK